MGYTFSFTFFFFPAHNMACKFFHYCTKRNNLSLFYTFTIMYSNLSLSLNFLGLFLIFFLVQFVEESLYNKFLEAKFLDQRVHAFVILAGIAKLLFKEDKSLYNLTQVKAGCSNPHSCLFFVMHKHSSINSKNMHECKHILKLRTVCLCHNFLFYLAIFPWFCNLLM